MVKCHLSRLLGERKLKISDVVRDTGINRGTLTRLYHETAQRVEPVSYTHLDVYKRQKPCPQVWPARSANQNFEC